jgi:hypothetical protein
LLLDLSSELNVQSTARIVVARNIRGRLLVNCRPIDDLVADDLRALTSLAARGTVELTYVTPQLEETLLHACLATLCASSVMSRTELPRLRWIG